MTTETKAGDRLALLDNLDALTPSALPTVALLWQQVPGLPRVALSIRQPWSFFIVHGFKDVENRTWRTSFRGRVLIHAGSKHDRLDEDGEEFIREALGRPYPRKLNENHAPMGGIVGVAEIVDCVDFVDSPWFGGPFGFVLRNAKPLPFVPLPGKLGFFAV